MVLQKEYNLCLIDVLTANLMKARISKRETEGDGGDCSSMKTDAPASPATSNTPSARKEKAKIRPSQSSRQSIGKIPILPCFRNADIDVTAERKRRPQEEAKSAFVQPSRRKLMRRSGNSGV